jgi:hypothetical protein
MSDCNSALLKTPSRFTSFYFSTFTLLSDKKLLKENRFIMSFPSGDPRRTALAEIIFTKLRSIFL